MYVFESLQVAYSIAYLHCEKYLVVLLVSLGHGDIFICDIFYFVGEFPGIGGCMWVV